MEVEIVNLVHQNATQSPSVKPPNTDASCLFVEDEMIPEITLINENDVMHQISSDILNGQVIPDFMKITFDSKVEERVQEISTTKKQFSAITVRQM